MDTILRSSGIVFIHFPDIRGQPESPVNLLTQILLLRKYNINKFRQSTTFNIRNLNTWAKFGNRTTTRPIFPQSNSIFFNILTWQLQIIESFLNNNYQGFHKLYLLSEKLIAKQRSEILLNWTS